MTTTLTRSIATSGEVAASRLSRGLGVALLAFLTGYAIFDKGFAYFHIPGTPLFGGELVLAAGVLLMVIATPRVRAGVTGFPAFALLAVFIAWCAFRMFPFFPEYGLDAVRDSSTWYYSFFAVIVVTLLQWRPELLGSVVRWYLQLIPWLFAFSALHLVVGAGAGTLPNVPDSEIPMNNFRPGNLAIQCAIAVAAMWLLPLPDALKRRKWLYTGIGLVLIAAFGTQNRGGMLAALVGLAIAWLFARGRIKIVLVTVAFVSVALGFAWIANIQVSTGSSATDRTVSVDQLIANVGSIADFGGGGSNSQRQLEGTVEWRDALWHKALALRDSEGHALDGLGFGRNLGESLGFSSGGDVELRSPHNSHVDILVRTGWVGFGFWAALWLAWAVALLAGRKRYRIGSLERTLIEVCIVGAAAILVNAYFDPSIESPQVAMWLWSLYGLGAWLVARAKRPRALPTAVGDAS